VCKACEFLLNGDFWLSDISHHEKKISIAVRGITNTWFDVTYTEDPMWVTRKESTMTEQMILETTPLNAVDRCDRCGAQAYVRAVLLSGGELLFCGHHGKEYSAGLKSVVAKIQDETSKLIDEPSIN
jgi:hypothetical protein